MPTTKDFTNKPQKGFAVIESLLILVVIAILGGTGYYVWHAEQKTDESLNNTAKTSLNVPKGSAIKTYDDCVKSPSSIEQQTYPPVCVTKAGQRFTNSSSTSQSTTPPPTSFSAFSGTITQIDLSRTSEKGLKLYSVDVEGQNPTLVGVYTTDTTCDAEAVTIPVDLKVGDRVSVSSLKGGGAQVVCKKGTFIKFKD